MLNLCKVTEYNNKYLFISFQSLTDAVIGFADTNGRSFIMDMWTTGYLQPILEPSQDITKTEGKIEDGFTTLKFSRARQTNDNQDVAFTDDKGMYMIFPVKGGSFNSVNKKLRKHEETPIPSAERILIKSCRYVIFILWLLFNVARISYFFTELLMGNQLSPQLPNLHKLFTLPVSNLLNWEKDTVYQSSIQESTMSCKTKSPST